MNQEFQNLRERFGNNSRERQEIIMRMRDNLLGRNGGGENYTFVYTQVGRVVNINNCENVPEDLFAIDGDMNPLGL